MDISIDINLMNPRNERVMTAVQLAYNEYMKYLDKIKYDLRLGKINNAVSEIIANEGTLFKIKFEIVYKPDGDTMDCNTTVLENFAKAYEVKNVSCDCCQEIDGTKVINVMRSCVSQPLWHVFTTDMHVVFCFIAK